MKRGRPSFEWTDDVEAEIFGRIMDGESLRDICGVDRDDWLPSQRTVYARLAVDEEFSQRYTRAREVQAHHEVDEIKAIADAATAEDVQVARLRVDARKWRAGKLNAKKYGDKLDVDMSGAFKVTIGEDDAGL